MLSHLGYLEMHLLPMWWVLGRRIVVEAHLLRSLKWLVCCLLVLPCNLRKKHFSSWLLILTFPHSWQLLCSKNFRIMHPHMSIFADNAVLSSFKLEIHAFQHRSVFFLNIVCCFLLLSYFSLWHLSPEWWMCGVTLLLFFPGLIFLFSFLWHFLPLYFNFSFD